MDGRSIGYVLVGGSLAGLAYLAWRSRAPEPIALPPGTTPAAPTPEPPPPAPPPVVVQRQCPAPGSKVLLIGDSLSYLTRPLFKKLAADCGTPLVNSVKGAQRVHYWTPRIVELMAHHKPTAVIASLGGNSFGFTSLEDEVKHIELLLAAIPQSVWFEWIEPPAFLHKQYQDKKGIRAAWRSRVLARPRGIVFETVSKAADIPISSDLVHPAGPGLTYIADGAWKLLSTATYQEQGPFVG